VVFKPSLAKGAITRRNSMQFKLMMALLLILAPILFVVLFGSISSINVVRQQVETINQNIINLYMNQIDDSLISAYQTISVLAVTDTDLSTIGSTSNESVQYFAKFRLLKRLEDELAVYKNIFGYFIYSTDGSIKQACITSVYAIGPDAERFFA
jgi:hypothetical protein